MNCVVFFNETTSWKCFEQDIEDVSKYFEEVIIRQTRCSYWIFRQLYILRLLVISGPCEVHGIFYWNYPMNDLTVSFRKQALGSYNIKIYVLHIEDVFKYFQYYSLSGWPMWSFSILNTLSKLFFTFLVYSPYDNRH